MTVQEEQNLATARRFVEEFLGQGKMTLAAEILDERIQVTTGLKPMGPIDGRAEYVHIFSGFYQAFPPVKPLVILDSFAAENRVVIRFQSFQKHVQEYFGVAPTERIITFDETHVMRLQEGKIVENIVSATNLEFEMLMAPVLTPMILK